MPLLKSCSALAFVCLLSNFIASQSWATENNRPSTLLQTSSDQAHSAKRGGKKQIVLNGATKGRSHQLVYLGKEKIPNFNIQGHPARIHTQGIYVTHDSLYVTGRLENPRKRALLLRFNRHDLSQVEHLDLVANLRDKHHAQAGQDHPGGFDYDGQAFWIPVAISKPHSPTSVVRVQTPLDSPLAKASAEVAFTVDDHIGALAVERQKKLLYGANWNTKQAYVWTTDGDEQKRIPRNKLIQNQPTWALAVQDWKCLADGTILASGSDKNPQRDSSLSRAVIDRIDFEQNKLLERIHLVDPDRGNVSLTHEGMALFKNELFLLPGDLGKNATLYRYRIEAVNK